jgi:hypothetical protein
MLADRPLTVRAGAEILTPGVFSIPYPFVRETFLRYGEEEIESWRPGVRFELVPPDDSEAVADGLGRQLLTVVSAHKPGRYPERIFYTRGWEDPTGKTFGKPRLLVATADKFRRLTKGYAHVFRLLPVAERLT